MQKLSGPLFVLMLTAIAVSPRSASARTPYRHTTTVTGTISVASLDSAIEAPGDVAVGFPTHSAQAKVIFSSCGDGDLCRVTGTTHGTGIDTFFTKVTKAVLVSHR